MKSKKNKRNSKKKNSFFKWILIVILASFVIGFVIYKINPVFAENVINEVSELKEKIFSENDLPLEISKDGSDSVQNEVVSQKEEFIPSEEENSPLYFGNPSGAVKEKSNSENYLIEKNNFTLSYNSVNLIPNWVSWHLSFSDLGDAERGDDFRPDSELPDEWYKVLKSDYQYTKYNFDRGHVCPSADRTKTQEGNSETFLMTNMIPQSPDLNRQIWKDFESFERSLALDGNELYIIAGPYGKGGTTATGTWDYIEILEKKKNPLSKNQKILVPSHCWKIVLVLSEGDKDFSRVTEETEVISVFMPNSMGMHKNGSWENYLTSVDYIEEKTGYDFFQYLPDEIENSIEKKVYSK